MDGFSKRYAEAVGQLVDVMDEVTERPFIKMIAVQRDSNNYDSWIAYAILEDKDIERLWHFKYAIYFDDRQMIADGF